MTYRELEFYYHEDFYKAMYSPNIMKIFTRLRTVPTYALDWATIVAHIPWISHSLVDVIVIPFGRPNAIGGFLANFFSWGFL